MGTGRLVKEMPTLVSRWYFRREEPDMRRNQGVQELEPLLGLQPLVLLEIPSLIEVWKGPVTAQHISLKWLEPQPKRKKIMDLSASQQLTKDAAELRSAGHSREKRTLGTVPTSPVSSPSLFMLLCYVIDKEQWMDRFWELILTSE